MIQMMIILYGGEERKDKLIFTNTPCHTYPPHLPDEPYFQRPLSVYNKGLKYLQKTQAFPYKHTFIFIPNTLSNTWKTN